MKQVIVNKLKDFLSYNLSRKHGYSALTLAAKKHMKVILKEKYYIKI